MTTHIRNLADLRALRARLVALPSVGTRIAKRVAVDFSALSRAAFEARQTPAGKAWEPSKTTGKPITLKKSGELEHKATTYTATGTRVRASVLALRYARYQLRLGFLPRRLPPAWNDRVKVISADEIARALRGDS